MFEEANINEIYNKDPDLKESDVRAIQEWAEKQPHLPKISELQILLFLQSCYYSNEMAKSTLDNYFTVKTLCPDLYGNRNLKDPNIIKNPVLNTTLPKQTPDGYTIMYSKLLNTNPDLFHFATQIKCFDMVTLLTLHKYGPLKGIVIVIDMEGVVFGHLTKLNVVVMKKFLYYLQEAMPIRLKGFHFINIVPFMDKILALMKPFMKKELTDMLHVHENMDNFYKFVPKDCMPQDLGGSVEPTTVLNEKQLKILNENADFFQFEETQKVDESKRQGKPKNVGDFFGMEGTFKKLEVD